MAFGKLVAFASREAVETFERRYYRQTTQWNRPPQPTVCTIPDDYDRVLVALRARLRLSQSALAERVGAGTRRSYINGSRGVDGLHRCCGNACRQSVAPLECRSTHVTCSPTIPARFTWASCASRASARGLPDQRRANDLRALEGKLSGGHDCCNVHVRRAGVTCLWPTASNNSVPSQRADELRGETRGLAEPRWRARRRTISCCLSRRFSAITARTPPGPHSFAFMTAR
jgi:hypothetical protein